MKVEIRQRYTGAVIYEAVIDDAYQGQPYNACLRHAIECAIKDGASIIGADLRCASLGGLRAQEVDFSGCDLRGAIMNSTALEKCQFRKANLRFAHLTMASLNECDFSKAVLRDAVLHGAHINGADFSECDLRGADLTHSIGTVKAKDHLGVLL